MTLKALTFRSPAETLDFGFRLGQSALPGDLIALYGDLGAGKTCLTQGIAAGLGIDANTITSPTYALIHEHRSGRIPLYHMDAYRILDPAELGPIGFDEYIARGDGFMVIEWANNIHAELPDDKLACYISISATADERDVRVSASGARAQALLDQALALSGRMPSHNASL